MPSPKSIIADPPYFNVLEDEAWDTQWKTAADYLAWCEAWVAESMRVLRDDGLCFIFGQLGKREHTFLHLMSRLTQQHQFHDLIIWDRAVGYDERRDSFTPQYEMVLVLRKGEKVKFNKDAVRIPYDAKTIETLPQRQALQRHGRPPRPSRSRQVRHQHPPRAQFEGQLEGKVRPSLAEAHRPHRKAHRLLHR
jgi:DNA modification methylase